MLRKSASLSFRGSGLGLIRTRPSSADNPTDLAVRAFEDTGTNKLTSSYNATPIAPSKFNPNHNVPAVIPLLQLTMTLLLPSRITRILPSATIF